MNILNKLKKPSLSIILGLFFVLVSCSSDQDLTNNEQFEIENLNTLSNKLAINKLINDSAAKTNLKDNYLNLKGINLARHSNEDEGVLDIEEQLQEFNNCSDCSAEFGNFLNPMFSDLIEAEDVELINKLNYYKNSIDSYSDNEITKANLNFILESFIASAEYTIENQENNASRSCGSSIGRGMVGGFISGCVNGAYAGAVAGTVTVPVIGTVTGAVAGCIASGAVGSVWGAAFGGLWGCILE